ncbi:SusC/RagA family TonB-linked outer membrane protein [Chryseobacterium indologenes]|uniref:SusC/RagA family TonB-linked outer membrane protein n=1 Tax=Chryseobacterium indologenes TaxID=253 RepID=UPI000F4D7979|nr:SusC/RagA family TonB-linked outer membrane protein [Chryseobacterium indologenes]AYZ36195.1 SusC/RagA family TonB-linked outer membrane protein [Chryseobacterium indologenes]MEB4760825.1 SusC/RagA family TonB-linked outer membrane protein [Chryseobacterium indologenes]
MKKLCRAVLLILFLSIGCQGLYAQEKLSTKRVNFETGKTTASEAVGKFLSENVKDKIYSNDDLKDYSVQPTKCKNELVMDCLNKILRDVPVETFIDNNSVIIRPKKNKSTSAIIENSSPILAKADTTTTVYNTKVIDEVILNAGYYKVSKKEQTGSIAKVSAKEIENQPISNVLAAAQGRMAGVSIVQSSGVPGSGFQVQIRGKNSLRSDGNNPLYIVDGVPIGNEVKTFGFTSAILPMSSISPLNSINPNDIESIEVLKDADATSIYGSRGANGVILVTTKKGKSGRLSVSLNSSYALSNVMSRLKMMNTEQYLSMRRQAFVNSGISTYPANAYDVNGTWKTDRYTDWSKSLIGNTATASNTQLQLTGGSETTSFLLSLGHNEQSTVFGNDFKYTTNSITTNIAHRSKDKKLNLAVSNMFSIQKNNVINSDITRSAFSVSPNAPALYNDDGTLNWENNTWSNPVAAYNATYSNQNIQYLTNLNIAYDLFKNITLKLGGGVNYQAFEEWNISPNTIYNPAYVTGQSSAYSKASKNNQNRLSYILEPQINWKFSHEKHALDILVGGTFQNENNSYGSMSGTGFESNALIHNISAAKTKTIEDQYNTQYRYVAFFGRVNYQLDKKYILNITGRRDGSSRFGPNKKFANFGAVGAAWLFSEENFLKNSSWLSFGKLRGSFGATGSDNIGDYGYLDTYTVSSSIYDGVTGLLPSRLFNPDFSWEKTKKLEAAIEVGLFRNKVNINTAWYRNRSSNQLVGYQLPTMTGFSSVLANLDATVQNTGWEFELNARPFSKGKFQWETSFNITFPKNKLISFPGLEGSTYSNTYVIGQPTSIVKLFNLEGIDPKTGTYIFTDYNGDGKISSVDDAKIVENIGVNFFGGLSSSLHYENWDFSLLFQFVKQKSRNYNYIIPSPGIMNNLPVEALDVWSPENPAGFYQPYKANASPNHSIFQNSTASVADGSFIRLKNVELAYNIPLKNTSFRSIRIYLQGQNLITWTKYFGIDPEFTTIGYLPPLRTFSFGLKLNL